MSTTVAKLTKKPPAGFQAIILPTALESRRAVEEGRCKKVIQLGEPHTHTGPVMFYCFNLVEEHKGISNWCGVGRVNEVIPLTLDQITEEHCAIFECANVVELKARMFEQHFGFSPERAGEAAERLMPGSSKANIVTWDFQKSYDLSLLERLTEAKRIFHPDAFSEWMKSNPSFMAGNIYMEGRAVLLMEAWARTVTQPGGLPEETLILP